MPDVSFPAIDGAAVLRNFAASDPGDGVLTPYRRTATDQQAELVGAINAVTAAITGGPESPPTPRSTTLAANASEDVFPASPGDPVWTRFRNVGPNDAFYCVGGPAVVGFVEGEGNFQLNVGESVQLPYKVEVGINMISLLGTNIEAEEWA